MKFYLKLIQLLSILLLPPGVRAQNCVYTLSGFLSDRHDHTALSGAVIKVGESGIQVMTDSLGHYHIDRLCAGKYTLQTSYIGYQTSEVKVNLSRSRILNIEMSASSIQLKGVEVAGVKPVRKPLQITSHMEGKVLEMTRGESLGETLREIPGVNSVQTGPTISKPVIDGLYGNRVVILNSGVRQEGQQWGSEHAPEVDPFIGDQLTVVKGAASVMYGADAIGGVVFVEPAPLSYSPGVSGRLNLVGMTNSGLGAFSASLEDSPDKNNHFSWRVLGTARIAGNSKSAHYYLKNTGLREYNGALILGYRNKGLSGGLYASSFNTRLGIFSGSNVGSTEDRNNAINRPEPLDIYQSDLNYSIDRPYQVVNHQILKLHGAYSFEGAGSLNLQYSYQQNDRKEYDVVRGSSQDKYQYRFELNTQQADLYFEHRPFSGFSGRAGLSGIYQHNTYDGAYLIPFFRSYNSAAFLIERWNKGNLELEGGLRYDYKWMRATKRVNPRDNNSVIERPQFEYSQASGTLGASYHLPSDVRFTFTASKGWRPPSINELFIEGVHQGNAAYEKGDRTLKEEASLNLSLGISRQTGRLRGEANFYRNRINNFIYLQPQLDSVGEPLFVITQRGGFLSYQYVQVDARFTGADILINYDVSKRLKAGGKYSFVRAYDTHTNDHLIYIPADRVSGTLSYTLPDTRAFKSPSFAVTVSHVARQWRVRDDLDFAPAPAAYNLIDMAVTSAIPVMGYHCNLALTVTNLLNKEYRDYLNRFRYYSADIGRNIALRLQVPFGKTINQYNN